ncbi:MAG: cupredoxin domain-containing protein [Ekhidna sp.]
MKKALLSIALVAVTIFTLSAQDVQTIKLDQVPGEFKTTELTLKAGKSYVFEVTNEGVDSEVGFVIAPLGKTESKFHVANSYLSKTIKDGETASSQEVVLEAGEYQYWCPLNPTPAYVITVEK